MHSSTQTTTQAFHQFGRDPYGNYCCDENLFRQTLFLTSSTSRLPYSFITIYLKGNTVLNRFLRLLAIFSAFILMTGCAVNRATASLSPGADLSTVKSVYIQKEEGDDRAIDEIIKANLTKRGYIVTTGASEKPASRVDAALTYVDKWMWDITMYMLELTITLRNPENGFPLAVGNSFHTSLTRKSPEEMVEEVVGNILSAKTTEKTAKASQ